MMASFYYCGIGHSTGGVGGVAEGDDYRNPQY